MTGVGGYEVGINVTRGDISGGVGGVAVQGARPLFRECQGRREWRREWGVGVT